jgi:hypothetical protein
MLFVKQDEHLDATVVYTRCTVSFSGWREFSSLSLFLASSKELKSQRTQFLFFF